MLLHLLFSAVLDLWVRTGVPGAGKDPAEPGTWGEAGECCCLFAPGLGNLGQLVAQVVFGEQRLIVRS